MTERRRVSGHDIDPRLARLAVALAFVGGYVDAVGFVALSHVFTGHITGNTVMLAIDVAEGTSTDVRRRLLAIIMFLAGMVVAGVLNAQIVRRGYRSRLAPALVLEAVLLTPLILAGVALTDATTQLPRPAWTLYALIALAATALGLQNGTLRKVSGATVHTTYISGAVTTATEGVLARWFQRQDRKAVRSSTPAEAAAGVDAPDRAKLVMLFGIAVSFAVGALIGVAIYTASGLESLLLPFVLIVTMAAIDARRPFADSA